MNYRTTVSLSGLLLAAAFVTGPIGPAHAADAPKPAAAATGQGLDALEDDALLSELGTRGLTTLLNRAFEVNKVPEDARSGQLALIAIGQLNEPSAAKLTFAQKRTLVEQAVKGIEGALPSLRDPKALMAAAKVLITESVAKDVNTLEYWGENPKTQAQLRPVVEAVIKMYEKAQKEAQAAADKAANDIHNPNDKAAIQKYEDSYNLAMMAEYTKNLVNYDLVLAMDKADSRRKTIVDSTITYLKEFDVPTDPGRALIDLRIAKMHMVVGNADKAKALFDLVIKGDPKDFGTPPDISQQYEARYFKAVNELLAQKPDEAEKLMQEIIIWQQANLPKDDASQKGAAAAAAMLKYRILVLRSDLAKAPDDKKKFNDQAVAALLQLLKDQPALQGIIFEQLMAKLPDDAKLDQLDPLFLQALSHKGEELAFKPDALTPETTKTMDRAVAAAKELVGRTGKIDAKMSNDAGLLLGFFLQKQNKLPEAADAFLDFATKFAKDPTQRQNAELAINNAEAVVGQLRANEATIDDPAAVRVYERLLPLAIGQPYGHTTLAYEYAKRLLKQGNPAEAIKYFKLVPRNDKRLLYSHYYEMVAFKGVLDVTKKDAPERAGLLSQIQTLADDVRKGAEAAITTASDQDRPSLRSMLAGTSLLAAELARSEQAAPAGPQRALQVLADFENQAKGLPDEDLRLTDMLLIRVQSYMTLNQTDKATAELVKLLQKNPAEGGRLVYNVLVSLDDQLSRAEGAKDKAQIREIALNRAKLTGFLVDMARKSKDANINKLAYGYAVFDAEVQRYAAVQETTDAAQKAGLTRALELFQKLNTPENVEQYRTDQAAREAALKAAGLAAPRMAGQPPPAPPQYDPAVILGLARTNFDLGNLKEARDAFSRLVGEKKLGPPVRTTVVNGQPVDTDNDQFWEANYKLLRANFTLGDPSDVEKSKRYLKNLYVLRDAKNIGGKKWHADFESLRTEVMPDFDPNTLIPATSQPVAEK